MVKFGFVMKMFVSDERISESILKIHVMLAIILGIIARILDPKSIISGEKIGFGSRIWGIGSKILRANTRFLVVGLNIKMIDNVVKKAYPSRILFRT
jgi:hypothetical protein